MNQFTGYCPSSINPGDINLGPQDAFISWDALAGVTYYLVLTVIPINPTPYQGQPVVFNPLDPAASYTYSLSDGNYTAGYYVIGPPLIPGTPFWFEYGVQRTGDWSLTIQSSNDGLIAEQLPEPASYLYLLIGAGLCVAASRRHRQSSQPLVV